MILLLKVIVFVLQQARYKIPVMKRKEYTGVVALWMIITAVDK